MARGKKNKKDVKGEGDGSKPSTSQQADVESTDSLASLTLSESDQAVASTKSEKDDGKTETSQQPEKKEESKPQVDDDGGGLGLGLGSGKPRKKRKPKGGNQPPVPQSSGPQPTGPQLPGPQPPGLQPPGLQPPGLQPPGFQPPGFQPPGFQPPCFQSTGLQPPGLQPPGPQPPGRQPPGRQPPGRQPPGPRHPGLQPPGPQPTGPQPSSWQYPAAAAHQPPVWGAAPQKPPQLPAGPAMPIPQQQQQIPVQTPRSLSPTLSVKSTGSSKKQSQILCRFKIPEKRLSPEVPAIKIKVITNYLKLKYKDLKIYRYDVCIKPDKPKKRMPQVFKAIQTKLFKNHVIAFDQTKNLYTLKPILSNLLDSLDEIVEILDDNNASMSFQVVIKHTGIIDLGTITQYMKQGGSTLEMPMEAIQCVDVILQQGTLGNYVKAGRQFFQRPRNPIDLTHGMEMWTGLFQSAVFNSGAFINIDVAHKGFPRAQTLLDAVTRDFGMFANRELEGQRGFEEFQHFLKGLRVTALIGGDSKCGKKREFICNGVVGPPNKLTFNIVDEAGKSKNCTVADYFEIVKKYKLKYPRLNCLWVGPKDKNIYYPMELLEIVYGQAINKQLSDKQLPIMVKEAATHPHIRIQKIEEVIKTMRYSTSPQFKQFGLDISDKLTTIDAKILRPPRLTIGANRSVEPRRGAWQANGLLQAQSLQRWAIMLVDPYPQHCAVAPIVNMMMGCGRNLGMQIDRPMYMRENVLMRDFRNALLEVVQNGVNFVVVVITTRDRDAYHKVKRIAELEVGVLTQCIKEFTASKKMNEQTMRNILLKINSKLMGVNQALDVSCMPRCLQGPGVMLVGADVTHPSPDQSSVPSIAAVTASIDSKYFIYNIELSVQTPKKEMIMQFEDMMVDHFKVYQKHNGNKLPSKIYVLRDGVSDGQFAEVMNSELVALQRAYQRMAGPQARKPEILFLLVQKRHHTRLFTTDCNNVEPGTVVDTDIVHQRELNFYLVSHQAIKGTARPTRYHCVCNDGNLSVGEVEQLAFYLCHLYSRCARSVSYPTPTYYAHLACFRARSLTYGERFDSAALEKNPKRIHVMDKMLQFSRMFFV